MVAVTRATAHSAISERARSAARANRGRSARLDPFRYLAIHMNEAARQRARDLWTTPEFEQAQRQRKKIEALFAQMKNHIGLHRLRLRRLKFVREQFFLAATAQNIKRLVRFLSHPTTPLAPATA